MTARTWRNALALAGIATVVAQAPYPAHAAERVVILEHWTNFR
jgi:hypothetical protein